MILNENKNGCTFLRKVMLKKDPQTDEFVVNFVDSVSRFEERFLSDEQKGLLLAILDSLA